MRLKRHSQRKRMMPIKSILVPITWQLLKTYTTRCSRSLVITEASPNSHSNHDGVWRTLTTSLFGTTGPGSTVVCSTCCSHVTRPCLTTWCRLDSTKRVSKSCLWSFGVLLLCVYDIWCSKSTDCVYRHQFQDNDPLLYRHGRWSMDRWIDGSMVDDRCEQGTLQRGTGTSPVATHDAQTPVTTSFSWTVGSVQEYSYWTTYIVILYSECIISIQYPYYSTTVSSFRAVCIWLVSSWDNISYDRDTYTQC